MTWSFFKKNNVNKIFIENMRTRIKYKHEGPTHLESVNIKSIFSEDQDFDSYLPDIISTKGIK